MELQIKTNDILTAIDVLNDIKDHILCPNKELTADQSANLALKNGVFGLVLKDLQMLLEAK